ncbi:MAG: signal recognition particle-docking protein FtsY [Lysobacterales bacterium]
MFKWFRRNKDASSVTQTSDSAAAAPNVLADAQTAAAPDIPLPEAVVEYIPETVPDASAAQPAMDAGATVESAQMPAATAIEAPAAAVPVQPETPAVLAPADLHAVVESAPVEHISDRVPDAEPAPASEPPVAAVQAPAPPQPVHAEPVAEPAPLEPTPAEPARPRTLRERLAATARALTASVGNLFRRNPKLDEDLLEELETALIQADVGVAASTELVEQLRVRMRKREFADARALLQSLRGSLRQLLLPHAQTLRIPAAPRPFVILTVGVNGAGKTTTIGKLAMRFRAQGHTVMLAAGDTFRAAAVEQLKTWGERNQVPVIAQGSGADSASVIFDAFQAAKSRGIDVLIADTAGRLHTQGHLMAELAKVKRVLGKIDPDAPHETLLVIDGGTGQNALNQAKQFHQSVGLTGIVVTKLDGTAKGGMLFALCRELALPVRFIGVGEKREDLREFVADDFVDALLPQDIGQS